MTTNDLNKLSKWEISLLLAVFGSDKIQSEQDLIFLRKRQSLLHLRSCYDKLPEGFNRYRVLIESIGKKLQS